MLIVNQDKDKIFNLENIVQIYITHCEDGNSYYWILLEAANETYEVLGKYNVERRAKEVLDDIAKFYRGYDMKDDYSPIEAIAKIEVRKRAVFYMPEE